MNQEEMRAKYAIIWDQVGQALSSQNLEDALVESQRLQDAIDRAEEIRQAVMRPLDPEPQTFSASY